MDFVSIVEYNPMGFIFVIHFVLYANYIKNFRKTIADKPTLP